MVCVRVACHENDGNHENDENDKCNSDSYKQGVECWIHGNHGNHGNSENHGNPGCKSGKSKWGLKATLCNLRTIVYNCALLWPLWGHLSKGNFRHKMTTIVGNRGHSRANFGFPNRGFRNAQKSGVWRRGEIGKG